jgi:DNA polymerase epsilon subunit 3
MCSAAENAQRSGKKTVMPQDVYAAMKELEFDFMLPRLEAEVTQFTSIQADKRNTYRKKVRDEKKAAKDPQVPNGSGAATEDSPPAKRARRLSGDNGEHHSGSDEEIEGDETVDVEDDEVEDDEVEDEVVEEGLTEDLLEERVNQEEDDEMADGDESD